MDFDADHTTDSGTFVKGNLDQMDHAIEVLKRYGDVYVRKSSSGKGFHVSVDADITPEEELALRRELNDCKGRCIADESRVRSGLRSSRLFKWKSKTRVSKDYKVELHKTKQAGEWERRD